MYIFDCKSRNKHRCALANAGKTDFAQFNKAQSIHRGFSYRKMKDDDQKSSLHHWEPIPNFFMAPLTIFVRCKRKGLLQDGGRTEFSEDLCMRLTILMMTHRMNLLSARSSRWTVPLSRWNYEKLYILVLHSSCSSESG